MKSVAWFALNMTRKLWKNYLLNNVSRDLINNQDFWLEVPAAIIFNLRLWARRFSFLTHLNFFLNLCSTHASYASWFPSAMLCIYPAIALYAPDQNEIAVLSRENIPENFRPSTITFCPWPLPSQPIHPTFPAAVPYSSLHCPALKSVCSSPGPFTSHNLVRPAHKPSFPCHISRLVIRQATSVPVQQYAYIGEEGGVLPLITPISSLHPPHSSSSWIHSSLPFDASYPLPPTSTSQFHLLPCSHSPIFASCTVWDDRERMPHCMSWGMFGVLHYPFMQVAWPTLCKHF